MDSDWILIDPELQIVAGADHVFRLYAFYSNRPYHGRADTDSNIKFQHEISGEGFRCPDISCGVP